MSDSQAGQAEHDAIAAHDRIAKFYHYRTPCGESFFTKLAERLGLGSETVDTLRSEVDGYSLVDPIAIAGWRKPIRFVRQFRLGGRGRGFVGPVRWLDEAFRALGGSLVHGDDVGALARFGNMA